MDEDSVVCIHDGIIMKHRNINKQWISKSICSLDYSGLNCQCIHLIKWKLFIRGLALVVNHTSTYIPSSLINVQPLHITKGNREHLTAIVIGHRIVLHGLRTGWLGKHNEQPGTSDV
jgi:hypothetical protein